MVGNGRLNIALPTSRLSTDQPGLVSRQVCTVLVQAFCFSANSGAGAHYGGLCF